MRFTSTNFIKDSSIRLKNPSRRQEGRSPNRWTEKEARDGKYLQGDAFALHRDRSCFQMIAVMYVSKTSIINDN
jgi:hypothetical protein